MANFWKTKSGTELLILEERKTIGYTLPLQEQYFPLTAFDMNISIISGEIPRGLNLIGANLEGTPYEVVRDTRYTFVVRAEQYGVIDDRTYSIVVAGPDEPQWITQPGLLPVGIDNKIYYILDNEIIDFQLEAIDPDTIAGDNLEYYIAEGDGELPPGITLTTDGRLVGVVEPILAIEKAATSGNYDENKYGSYPYDFGIRPDNGFDSFFYDLTIYDLSTPSRVPKKLNRYYQFRVTVTDGDSIAQRLFQIYLVGDDYLRADNTIMKVANGVFTADNTYLRTPLWLTPANLGYRRANNYVTLFLDVIDTSSLLGIISYSLQPTNNDNSPSQLPPGMSLDSYSGEITGKVPYQPAVTREYKFTIRATRYVANQQETAYKDKTFTIKLLGEIDSFISWDTDPDLGLINSNYISTLLVSATTNVPNANLLYSFVSGKLPPGLTLNYDGEIIGKINSFGNDEKLGLTVFDSGNMQLDRNTTLIDREFKFTVRVQDHFGFSAITREFAIKVTDPDDKLYSNLFVKPFLKNDQRELYRLLITNNDIFDSNLIYRPNDNNFGIQKEMKMLVYAGIQTKAASYFMSAIAKNHKRKRFKFGDVKSAVAKKVGTQNVVYELIYVEILDPAEAATGNVRSKIKITNSQTRTVDTNLFNFDPSGVENTDPFGVYLTTRRFGEVANYFYPNFVVGTRTQDLLLDSKPITIEVNIGENVNLTDIIIGSHEPLRFRPTPENTQKADSDAISADEKNKNTKYISNISNMRNNIKKLGETELNYLPLWMRSSQPGEIKRLGFVKAVPICYCKPGTSSNILNRLKTYNFNFNQFDFEIDRYVIDSTEGISNEQYLLFHNYDFNV